ncbi:MAG TPA: hypothetical protein VH186_33340 [Chloroflexia bacterium]|nr:hypothetical protein [Chloroflexia bacterium]
MPDVAQAVLELIPGNDCAEKNLGAGAIQVITIIGAKKHYKSYRVVLILA